RFRREAYLLPDGAKLLVGDVKTTFKCPGDGYFADVDNGCRIFHVCANAGGPLAQHHSFMCGNLTVFNQLSLTCAYEEDAIPCSNAKDFFFLNGKIGVVDAPFLTDNDIERAAPLILAAQG
ncbi:unnamed protein product, partial [Ixodes hexagonus]